MTPRPYTHLIIIGRSEPIAFVDYQNLTEIPAKVDTGAYRSAIHADNIHTDDTGYLHFTLFANHPTCADCATDVSTNKFTKILISNSFGDTEERYEVTLKVKIGPRVFRESFTITNRSKKPYPILLGRKLLNGRFLVDPSFSSISRNELKTKHRIAIPKDEETEYGDTY